VLAIIFWEEDDVASRFVHLNSFEEKKGGHTKLYQSLKLWNERFGNTTVLYTHILRVHLADFIRRLPQDPIKMQTQGLEHFHKLRKKQHLRSTNFKKPTTAKNKDGSSKRCRTAQVLSINVVIHYNCYDWNKDCYEHQKLLNTIRKRVLAKARRLATIAEL
jgi:hypothetical protein